MTARSAFVAGATGYTGREVVRELVAAGVETHAHVRPDSSSLASWRERFADLGAQVDTTAWDEEAMAARLRELSPSLVFALLGTTKSRARRESAAGKPASSYETVDYGLTMLLWRAAPSDCRFVYLSSLGVGDREPSNAYLAVRYRVERALRESERDYVIVRPSFISGDDRDESRLGERVGATVVDGALGVLGALGAKGLRDRYQSLTGAELGAAMVRVALDPAARRSIVEADALR